jgi:phosphoribosyl-ATP pyrophosphohydrolase
VTPWRERLKQATRYIWSRSRGRLWHKGEESGHTQKVREIRIDCDNDVVLLKIEQVGGIACHTGRRSCFFQKYLADGRWGGGRTRFSKTRRTSTNDRYRSAAPRGRDPCRAQGGRSPDSSYVSGLFHKGTDAICKKVAEEAAETIMAAKDGDAGHLVKEVCDLWFHSMVLLAHHGLGVDDVLHEFRRREGISGLDENRRQSGARGGTGTNARKSG